MFLYTESAHLHMNCIDLSLGFEFVLLSVLFESLLFSYRDEQSKEKQGKFSTRE